MSNSSRADEGLEYVIHKYKRMVFAIALSHTGNRSDADDVFQDVFLTYYKKNVAFNDEEHRKAWLIKTAINCSKRVTFNPFRKNTVSLSNDLPCENLFSTDEQNTVFSALGNLPQKYRVVLHLFYFEDMAVKEIADNLDINEGAVKMRLMRGREQLRQELKGDFFDE